LSSLQIIAPVPIEEFIATQGPAISKVVIVGDNRDYNVALCTLQQEGANGELMGTGVLSGLATTVSPAATTTAQAMTDAVWIDYIRKAIEAVNANEKICLNRAFRVRKFTILPRDFSIEKDENTPTLKFKRSVIEQNYRGHIDKMYSTPLDDSVDVAYVDTSDVPLDLTSISTPNGNGNGAAVHQNPPPLTGKL